MQGLDWIAGVAAFKAVLLEGVEVVFIVIAIGAGGLLWLASAGAVAACVGVAAIGWAALGPLSQVPENSLKFAVGIMLSAFGLFWTGESLGVDWPGGDAAIFAFAALFLIVAVALVAFLKAEQNGAGMIAGIAKQLLGLFVDDGLLAAGFLVAVAPIAGLAALPAPLPAWLAGLLLTVSLPGVLAASVLRSVRRARRAERGGGTVRCVSRPPTC